MSIEPVTMKTMAETMLEQVKDLENNEGWKILYRAYKKHVFDKQEEFLNHRFKNQPATDPMSLLLDSSYQQGLLDGLLGFDVATTILIEQLKGGRIPWPVEGVADAEAHDDHGQQDGNRHGPSGEVGLQELQEG